VDLDLVRTILNVLLIVLIGVPLLAYLGQDRLIFFPQPSGAAQREALAKRYPAVRELFVQSADGARLHAWHVRAQRDSTMVIYFGGNAEDVSWMLEQAITRTPSVSWLLVDYRGYGASEGSPSEASLHADALLWYGQAAALSKRIFVFGRSVGSGVAVRLASERAVAGVVLVTPFDSLVSVAQRHYPYLPVSSLLRHRFDSIALAPRIAAPLLCLTASQDEIIPPEHARRLYDAWMGPKQWIALDGATHNSADGHANYWPSIEKFLSAP
jgi:pimeloyl-ACP methyl ester carboxylesterase